MMRRMAILASLLPALLALVSAAGQATPPAPATIVVNYASTAKNDTKNSGEVTVGIKAGEVRAAIVWESECSLAARVNAVAAAPGVDQYWSFVSALETSPDGRPGIRVRYQRIRVAAAGPQPPEQNKWIPLDGVTAVNVTETSWRKNCRYKEFTIALTAKN